MLQFHVSQIHPSSKGDRTCFSLKKKQVALSLLQARSHRRQLFDKQRDGLTMSGTPGMASEKCHSHSDLRSHWLVG